MWTELDDDGGGPGVGTEAGDGRVGSGVGGGEEYTLRSGGSAGRGEDSPKPPRPLIEDPPDSIWPCTPLIPANIGAEPDYKTSMNHNLSSNKR